MVLCQIQKSPRCLARKTIVQHAAIMLRARLAVLLPLVIVAAAACDDGGDAVDTCSTENLVDDVDDGTGAEATEADDAPTDLAY